MNVDLIPTLIDQFRETFEGKVGEWVWIVDATPNTGVFASIESVSVVDAYVAPAAGMNTIAAHVAHLRFSLDLTHERLQGENPPADWASSFATPDPSTQAWETQKAELRRAYDAVLALLQESRAKTVQEWPAINVVGLAAMTAHNAYHLGAIRQLVRLLNSCHS